MRIFFTTLLVLFITFQASYSQRVENVKAVVEGNFVYITYKLTGAYAQQNFNIKLYSSHDNYAKALMYVTGDVNRNDILPGTKKISWDAKKELDSYDGEVNFKIVATVISRYKVTSPVLGDKIKKGNQYNVGWEGFADGDNFTVTLMKNNIPVTNLTSWHSGDSYRWNVKGVPPGKGYSIKVISSSNKKAYAQSGTFTIRRKIPLAITISAAGLITGAAAYYLLKPEVFAPLPDPPTLPGD